MSTEVIVVSGLPQTLPVVINAAFAQAKANALAEASMVGDVTNSMTQGFATEVLMKLNAMVKSIEKSRVDVKDGPLKLCKLIDATAKQASIELESAAKNISLKLSDYQRKLDEETARIRREEQAKLAEIERQKQAEIARAAAAAAEAAKSKPPEVAQAEIAKATQAATQAAQQAAQQVLAAAPVQRKVEGQVVRRSWKYELLDIQALHAARPELVTLTEKAAAINALIRGDNGERNIPGLRIFQDVEVGTR